MVGHPTDEPKPEFRPSHVRTEFRCSQAGVSTKSELTSHVRRASARGPLGSEGRGERGEGDT
jgi:hypothetical protein